MNIKLIKFGSVLDSHPSGKEAWLAFQPTLNSASKTEEVVVDFEGVAVFTPSWADEFLTPLWDKFGKKVKLINAENASVVASLETLKIS
jgi:hypothetical protein